MDEGDGMLQPTTPVCLHESVKYVTIGVREDERNINLKTLLNAWVIRDTEELVDLVKTRL